MRQLAAVIQKSIMVAAALITMGGAASVARAEKMDSETHTIVIEKLELALREAREDATLSLRPVRARLADLYAERARLRAMDEAEKNCQDCTGALQDRRRALALYDVVVKEAGKEKRGPVFMQMAHLNELNGHDEKAAQIYERVIREGRGQHAARVLSASYVGRAERRFGKGDLRGAQSDFESALRYAPVGNRGQITHRIAWCHLNKGEQQQAVRTLVRILRSDELLSRETENGLDLDESFQEDVARDLATFLARGSVGRSEVALLESVTPDKAKKDTMKHFANECERLGQKRSAIFAWEAFVTYENQPVDRLEAMVRVAQIRFDLGEKPQALGDMKEAVAFWKKAGCNDAEVCEQLQQRLRQLVVVWNKTEKKAKSSLLLEAYLTYLAKFEDDTEMTFWAAETARSLKRYPQAAALYHKSSLLAVGPKNDSNTKEMKTLLESSLVGEVEMAELAKNKDMREAAYDHYLKLNPQGAIAGNVRYQRAHVSYERGDTREAANRFFTYATGEDCRNPKRNAEISGLCVKAADLDLDSLVGMKDHAAVESHALTYAKMYPSRAIEHRKIARTAVLKQAETQVEPAQALVILGRADMTGANADERIRFYRQRIALAEKTGDLTETRRAAYALLDTKGISAEDKEFALGKVAWAAEMQMDFGQAYEVSRKLKMSNLRPDERAMKLALLAELSGRSSRGHEEEFLRLSRDNARKALVRAKIVRAAGNPVREYAKHESFIRPYPSILAPLALEIFARTGDVNFARKAIRTRGVTNDPSGSTLAQQLFMRDLVALDQKIARHRIRSSSNALVQKTLVERIRLLDEVERAANQAIGTRDWTLQLISLTTVTRENKRLHSDIMALPVPWTLKGKQREEYRAAVQAKADPFAMKGDQAEKKLRILWGNYDSQKALFADHRGARPEVRGLIKSELRTLARIAPNGLRKEFEEELQEGVKVPTTTQVAEARQDVKAKPFDRSRLSRLRDLELERGRETMVVYLDARMAKLDKMSVSPGGVK